MRCRPPDDAGRPRSAAGCAPVRSCAARFRCGPSRSGARLFHHCDAVTLHHERAGEDPRRGSPTGRSHRCGVRVGCDRGLAHRSGLAGEAPTRRRRGSRRRRARRPRVPGHPPRAAARSPRTTSRPGIRTCRTVAYDERTGGGQVSHTAEHVLRPVLLVDRDADHEGRRSPSGCMPSSGSESRKLTVPRRGEGGASAPCNTVPRLLHNVALLRHGQLASARPRPAAELPPGSSRPSAPVAGVKHQAFLHAAPATAGRLSAASIIATAFHTSPVSTATT